MYFFVCSILKNQLNTDILDENGTFQESSRKC